MSKSINKKHKGSISSNTVEPRRSERVWLGNGLSVSPSSNIGPSPRRKAAWMRVYSCRRKTATEIVMGEEREYKTPLYEEREAAQSRSGHKNVQSYYNAIRELPYINGVVEYAREHVSNLEGLDAVHGNMYYSKKDELFVGDWSIETPEIYHRHKELGTYLTQDGMNFMDYSVHDYNKHNGKCPCGCGEIRYKTHIMWDAAKGECGLCGEQMSGEVMMMHKFYQF